MTPAEYCQNKAAKSGSSFYYSFLFLPDLQRQAITAVYAFCREVDDVVDECKDPNVARTKLAWWREEIRTTFSESGKPNHPVCKALVEVIKHFDLQQEYFLEIIDGMEMDLDQKRYATFSELTLYCYRVASVVGLLAAEIFGYRNLQTLKYAHNLGIAFQLTNIVRDIKEDMNRARIYLPTEELEQYGVTEQDFLQQQCSEHMRDLLDFQVQRALDYYDKAFELLPEEDRFSQRTGLIMATIYMKTLEIIQSDSCQVLNDRVALSPIRKLWLSWRTARIEKKRFKKFTTTNESYQQQ